MSLTVGRCHFNIVNCTKLRSLGQRHLHRVDVTLTVSLVQNLYHFRVIKHCTLASYPQCNWHQIDVTSRITLSLSLALSLSQVTTTHHTIVSLSQEHMSSTHHACRRLAARAHCSCTGCVCNVCSHSRRPSHWQLINVSSWLQPVHHTCTVAQ